MRIPGLKDLTYCHRLARLKLDSLELRRVRLDLIFTYKLVFGLTDLKLSDFFVLRNDARSQGHPYRLFLPGCSSTTRHNYFSLLIGLHGLGITCQRTVLIFPV